VFLNIPCKWFWGGFYVWIRKSNINQYVYGLWW
jgi:hypothetical protein